MLTGNRTEWMTPWRDPRGVDYRIITKDTMVMGAAPKALALGKQFLAYSTSMTIHEFLACAGPYQGLFRQRMAEVRLQPDDQYFLASYPDFVRCVALVTVEDPDTIAVLPVAAQMFETGRRLDLRILVDDSDLSLIDPLLDELNVLEELDDLDLPQFFFFDEDWQIQAQWGPRPQAAEAYLDGWLEAHPEYDSLADSDTDGADSDAETQDAYAALVRELVYEMRCWYNSGLTQACVAELRAVLTELQSSDDDGDDGDDGDDVDDGDDASDTD